MLDLQGTSHRRFNPLTREWILVSPHRTARPWQGRVEKTSQAIAPAYDPDCYLCPGNGRAAGARNPQYTGTFVFDNDFAALLPEAPGELLNDATLLRAEPEPGICRVVCFSPRHDLTIPRMSPEELLGVIAAWIDQFADLERNSWVRHIQVFENRGALMGASNPHPHGQIWANSSLPNLPARELESLAAYRHAKNSCLLCDYLALELKRAERVVCQNDAFAVVVPFWAVWPFETLLLSKRHLAAMDELSQYERASLADILRRITTRYDNLFEISFPYSMGFHQRPTGDTNHADSHFHAHYFPPLLRSATVQKFMVGYELLDSPQRDITAESAAARLKELSDIHYLDRA
ncbi:MAG: UDP-glucose--hexose-1-phosphate uridylyltransferase [Candidatus Acidiferrales bacterium]